MKTTLPAAAIVRAAVLLFLLATFNSRLSTLFAQGTAFTYQGRLNDGANAANGNYDLRFAIYDSASGGVQQGVTLTNTPTAVTNGLFTVALDFGAGVFNGADRWLEIAVRTNGGGAFTNLSPRQPLTSTPYAVRAGNAASAGAVAAGNITGSIGLAQLPVAVVTNGARGVDISGTFSGNGAGVTNVNLASLNNSPLINFPGNFVIASSLDTGLGPASVTAADVNGDGKVDLISANFGANTLSILTNNGKGGFALASSPAVGSGPYSVVAADLNGDGKVDLISANSGANSLSILTNNGFGFFVLASSPNVGSGPVSIVAADVNGDGNLDLISANYDFFSNNPGTLSLLINDGSGAFFSSYFVIVGIGPASVAAADVNGDGKVDLISADSGSDTLRQLRNNGSSGFVLASLSPVGSQPVSVVTADVNGDGMVDLISANSGANTLSILTNNGLGFFVLASSPNVGSGPVSVVAADVNGDGRVDLICANSGDNTLSVLFNAPSFQGSFTGSGTGLSSLNAASVTGTLGTPQIPNLDASKITTGTLGPAQIPNLDAAKITTGTLTDARLSSNVALRAGGNTFSGGQTFNGQIRLDSTDGFSQSAVGNFYIDAPFIIGGRVAVLTNGNVGLGIATPTNKLHVIGGTTFSSGAGGANQSVVWSPGSASWSFTSDRNAKDRVVPVQPGEVLAKVCDVPVAEWSYIGYDQRHIGPMAQDFHAAFPLNGNNTSLNDADLHGVALAAIQGLNQKLDGLKREIEHKNAENTELKRRLDALEKIVFNQNSK